MDSTAPPMPLQSATKPSFPSLPPSSPTPSPSESTDRALACESLRKLEHAHPLLFSTTIDPISSSPPLSPLQHRRRASHPCFHLYAMNWKSPPCHPLPLLFHRTPPSPFPNHTPPHLFSSFPPSAAFVMNRKDLHLLCPLPPTTLYPSSSSPSPTASPLPTPSSSPSTASPSSSTTSLAASPPFAPLHRSPHPLRRLPN